MTNFAADFDLTCDYLRLSPEERANAWGWAHYRPAQPLSKAVRIYAAIARSLTLDEINFALNGR